MGSPSLFADCQNFIKKGHESWKSYFTKWEAFAKYEDEIAENDLFGKLCDDEKFPKKKEKRQLCEPKPKTNKKNVVKKKKLVKKKTFLSNEFDTKRIEQFGDSGAEDVGNTQNEELVKILNSVFLQFLEENNSKLHIFAALPPTYPSIETTNSQRCFYNNQESFLCNNSQLVPRDFSYLNEKPLSTSVYTVNNRSVFFAKTIISHNQNPGRNVNLIKRPLDHNELRQTERRVVKDFSNFSFHNNLNLHYFSLTNSGSGQSPQQRTQISLDKITSPAFLSSYKNSKPLKWDFAHKYLGNTYRRVNKEYFIKRAFSKMNIIQNGKRFGNLYSHKRTNSVSLSLENSNLVTPERKPPERKCFSENVFKRKRKHPSKLFFDDEVEESESDDQNENTAPIICCKNKILKNPIITKVEESDSDDSESIFDRVKKF